VLDIREETVFFLARHCRQNTPSSASLVAGASTAWTRGASSSGVSST
jgi:hypothetical protein